MCQVFYLDSEQSSLHNTCIMPVVCIVVRVHTNVCHSSTALCACVPCTEELLFDDAGSYAFMSNGYVPVAGVNDANEYEDTVEAMNIMGLPEDEQSGEACVCVRVCCVRLVCVRACV